MKYITFFMLLLSTTLLAFDLQSDSLALLAVKEANPQSRFNWNSFMPVVQWEGVTVRNGRVVTLIISSKELSSLPPEIGNLNALEEFRLWENNLGILPPEIGKLHSLTFLQLSKNRLSTLPSEIGSLSKLKRLIVDYNSLSSIPESIGDLQNLEYLILNFNEIESLPLKSGKLQSLEVLELNFNDFHSLPAEIGTLKRLRVLRVGNNKLTSLSPEIVKLENLGILSLDCNHFKALPNEILMLKKLKYLCIRSNPLAYDSPVVKELTELKILNTRCRSSYVRRRNSDSLALIAIRKANPEAKLNWYSNLPMYKWDGKISIYRGRVERLELIGKGDAFTTIPPEIGTLTALKSLTLDSNSLCSLPPEIGNLSNLTHLSIKGNRLSSLPAEIGNLRKLRVLTVSDNRLTSLPVEIGRVRNVVRMDVSNNYLSALPAEIGNISWLVDLQVNDNQLTSLPKNITSLNRLCSLDISSNSYEVIPSELKKMVHIKKIKLGGNPTIKMLPKKIGDLVQTDDQIYVPKEKKGRIFAVDLISGRVALGWGVIGKKSGLNLRCTTGPVLYGERGTDIAILPFAGYQGLYSLKDDNAHFITTGVGIGYRSIAGGWTLGSINGSVLLGWEDNETIIGGRVGARVAFLDILGGEVGVTRFSDNWGAEVLVSFDIGGWLAYSKSGVGFW